MGSRPGGMPQPGGQAQPGAAPSQLAGMMGPNMFSGGGGGPPPMPTPPPGNPPPTGMMQPHMPAVPPGGGGFMQMLASRLPPQLIQNPQFMHLMQMLGGGLGGGMIPGGPQPPITPAAPAGDGSNEAGQMALDHLDAARRATYQPLIDRMRGR